MSPPTPMPCTARAPISQPIPGARPAIADPATKMTSATCTSILRLKRSASFPQIGVVAVVVSRVAVITQVYADSPPPRSPMIVGSALVTTVDESIATNMPMSRPDSASSTSRWLIGAAASEAAGPVWSVGTAVVIRSFPGRGR